MNRREGDRAGGINIEDLKVKCKQKVVVVVVGGGGGGGGGVEGAETDNIRTLDG